LPLADQRPIFPFDTAEHYTAAQWRAHHIVGFEYEYGSGKAAYGVVVNCNSSLLTCRAGDAAL